MKDIDEIVKNSQMRNLDNGLQAFFYGLKNALKVKFCNDNPRYLKYEYEKINEILANEMCPCAFIDLDVFDANLDWLESQMAVSKKKVRLGTKSLRVPALIARALDRKCTKGLFIYHPNEIQYWQEKYKQNDFLLAYPIMNEKEVSILCDAIRRDPNTKIHVMVDSDSQLKILESQASKYNLTLGVIIDCDFSIKFLGQVAGVLRSPLKTLEEIINIVKKIDNNNHLVFQGIMGYEAQEAGIGDINPFYTLMKFKSRKLVNDRRKKIIEGLKKAGHTPNIVNGGGSGCFQETAAEDVVTEVTIGSGLFKSYIFDSIYSMKGFNPSLFMALRIVRFPKDNVATCFSGGYISSATNLSPKIILPENCQPTAREGFGEVQTPITFKPKMTKLNHGDLIICRFAKAGEPLEWFSEVIALSQGKIVDRYPTYRGLGIWGA